MEYLAKIDESESKVETENKKKHELKNAKEVKEKENYNLGKSLESEKNKFEERRQKHERISIEVENVERDVRILQKKLEHTLKNVTEIQLLRDNMNIEKEARDSDLSDAKLAHRQKKRQVDEDKKEVEQKERERNLLNKTVALEEEQFHKEADQDAMQENEKTKLKNQLGLYKQLIRKLHEEIQELEKDKYKYANAAGQANQQYYDSLEQVKVKNTLITKLQKKNLDIEARLKFSQNLYEAVRSDRNLHSKTLMEAQEEIDGLRLKFKRMLAQISTLKEEIGSKDQAILIEKDRHTYFMKKNEELSEMIEKIKNNINSSEKMIKTQDSDIARLKYVILEAESEKQKQKKDYEMVINERDILGT